MAVIRGLLLLLVASHALADDERAHVNYMLHCQGCHLPEAEGFDGKVPPIRNFVGYFLHSEEGRQFLIRVPGVAHAALDDVELAELMNWLVMTYSADQLPDPFVPYTPTEVAAFRSNPEMDPEATRERIIDALASDLPSLSVDVERGTR
jgi:hypothetical protein